MPNMMTRQLQGLPWDATTAQPPSQTQVRQARRRIAQAALEWATPPDFPVLHYSESSTATGGRDRKYEIGAQNIFTLEDSQNGLNHLATVSTTVNITPINNGSTHAESQIVKLIAVNMLSEYQFEFTGTNAQITASRDAAQLSAKDCAKHLLDAVARDLVATGDSAYQSAADANAQARRVYERIAELEDNDKLNLGDLASINRYIRQQGNPDPQATHENQRDQALVKLQSMIFSQQYAANPKATRTSVPTERVQVLYDYIAQDLTAKGKIPGDGTQLPAALVLAEIEKLTTPRQGQNPPVINLTSTESIAHYLIENAKRDRPAEFQRSFGQFADGSYTEAQQKQVVDHAIAKADELTKRHGHRAEKYLWKEHHAALVSANKQAKALEAREQQVHVERAMHNMAVMIEVKRVTDRLHAAYEHYKTTSADGAKLTFAEFLSNHPDPNTEFSTTDPSKHGLFDDASAAPLAAELNWGNPAGIGYNDDLSAAAPSSDNEIDAEKRAYLWQLQNLKLSQPNPDFVGRALLVQSMKSGKPAQPVFNTKAGVLLDLYQSVPTVAGVSVDVGTQVGQMVYDRIASISSETMMGGVSAIDFDTFLTTGNGDPEALINAISNQENADRGNRDKKSAAPIVDLNRRLDGVAALAGVVQSADRQQAGKAWAPEDFFEQVNAHLASVQVPLNHRLTGEVPRTSDKQKLFSHVMAQLQRRDGSWAQHAVGKKYLKGSTPEEIAKAQAQEAYMIISGLNQDEFVRALDDPAKFELPRTALLDNFEVAAWQDHFRQIPEKDLINEDQPALNDFKKFMSQRLFETVDFPKNMKVENRRKWAKNYVDAYFDSLTGEQKTALRHERFQSVLTDFSNMRMSNFNALEANRVQWELERGCIEEKREDTYLNLDGFDEKPGASFTEGAFLGERDERGVDGVSLDYRKQSQVNADFQEREDKVGVRFKAVSSIEHREFQSTQGRLKQTPDGHPLEEYFGDDARTGRGAQRLKGWDSHRRKTWRVVKAVGKTAASLVAIGASLGLATPVVLDYMDFQWHGLSLDTITANLPGQRGSEQSFVAGKEITRAYAVPGDFPPKGQAPIEVTYRKGRNPTVHAYDVLYPVLAFSDAEDGFKQGANYQDRLNRARAMVTCLVEMTKMNSGQKRMTVAPSIGGQPITDKDQFRLVTRLLLETGAVDVGIHQSLDQKKDKRVIDEQVQIIKEEKAKLAQEKHQGVEQLRANPEDPVVGESQKNKFASDGDLAKRLQTPGSGRPAHTFGNKHSPLKRAAAKERERNREISRGSGPERSN